MVALLLPMNLQFILFGQVHISYALHISFLHFFADVASVTFEFLSFLT